MDQNPVNLLLFPIAIAGIYGLYNIIAAIIPFDSIVVFGLKGSWTIKTLDTRKARISTLLEGIGWIIAAIFFAALAAAKLGWHLHTY